MSYLRCQDEKVQPQQYEGMEIENELKKSNQQFCFPEEWIHENKLIMFKCPVCYNLIRSTYNLPCVHITCTKCVDQSLNKSCPVCRKAFRGVLQENFNVPHLLSQMEGACFFQNRGCPKKLSLGKNFKDLLGHARTCEFRKVLCVFCDVPVLFKNLNEHALGCLARPEKCLLCQDIVSHKEKEGHVFQGLITEEMTCPRSKICPKKCGIGRVHVKIFGNHEQVCPLETHKCKYCEEQVMNKDMMKHFETILPVGEDQKMEDNITFKHIKGLMGDVGRLLGEQKLKKQQQQQQHNPLANENENENENNQDDFELLEHETHTHELENEEKKKFQMPRELNMRKIHRLMNQSRLVCVRDEDGFWLYGYIQGTLPNNNIVISGLRGTSTVEITVHIQKEPYRIITKKENFPPCLSEKITLPFRIGDEMWGRYTLAGGNGIFRMKGFISEIQNSQVQLVPCPTTQRRPRWFHFMEIEKMDLWKEHMISIPDLKNLPVSSSSSSSLSSHSPSSPSSSSWSNYDPISSFPTHPTKSTVSYVSASPSISVLPPSPTPRTSALPMQFNTLKLLGMDQNTIAQIQDLFDQSSNPRIYYSVSPATSTPTPLHPRTPESLALGNLQELARRYQASNLPSSPREEEEEFDNFESQT